MAHKSPRSILVVEDSALIAVATQAQLEIAGYEVVGPAASTAAALALVEKKRPDLALLDLTLERRHDGFALAHELFDRFGVCSLFVSAECAFVPPGACGCGCLQKPFFKDDLLRAVEAALHIANRDEVPEVKLSGLALWMLPRKSLSGAG